MAGRGVGHWLLWGAIAVAAALLGAIMFVGDDMLPFGALRTPSAPKSADSSAPEAAPRPAPADSAPETLAAQLDAYLAQPTTAAREALVKALQPYRGAALALLGERARSERDVGRLREHLELASLIGGPQGLPLLVEIGDRADLPETIRPIVIREVARSRSPRALGALLDWHATSRAGYAPLRGRLLEAAISVGGPDDLAALLQRAGREADAAQREACLAVKSGIEAKLRSQQATLAVDRATEAEIIAQLASPAPSWVRLRIVKKLGSAPSAAGVAALASCLPASPRSRLDDAVELNALVELTRLGETREDARTAVTRWARALEGDGVQASAGNVLAHYGGLALARDLRTGPSTPPWLVTAATAIEARAGGSPAAPR